jgi:ATP-dependent exoDNAse (exonuclease V) beta subunit
LDGGCCRSCRPRFKPVSVSGEAHAMTLDDAADATEPARRKHHEGRFGATFGSTVHRAIGLVLHNAKLNATEAVRLAAQAAGLQVHLEDAVADVERALAALRSEGLLRALGPDLQIEYPIAGPMNGGLLASGYIDLVGASENRLDLIDFKTDAPPQGPVAQFYPGYVAQVRAYAQLLAIADATSQRSLRHGLLFTADGSIHWV